MRCTWQWVVDRGSPITEPNMMTVAEESSITNPLEGVTLIMSTPIDLMT